MARGSVFSTLKGFDAFGKTMEDVKIKTRTGALLTLVSAAIILSFTLIEFTDYRTVYTDTSMLVDRSRGEKLAVTMNITFPKVPCFLLNMDVMDIAGAQRIDLDHTMVKTRLNEYGGRLDDGKLNTDLKNELDKVANQRGVENYCGSCYGGTPPEGGCCNSCESVRQAYLNRGWAFTNPDSIEQCVSEHWTEKIHEQSNEGCNLAGKIIVKKVVGTIFLSPGRSFLTNNFNVHDLVPYLKDGNPHTFGHIIHEFSFENESQQYKAHLTKEMRKRLGIVYSPLDTTGSFHPNANNMWQYFLKVVGTHYHFIDQKFTSAYQYSVTTYERNLEEGVAQRHHGIMTSHGTMGLPGVSFNFEISPMVVVHTERRQSFAHFLTSMCAIVGGVLTVASILDGVLFRTNKLVKKGAAAVQAEKESAPVNRPLNLRQASYGGNIKLM